MFNSSDRNHDPEHRFESFASGQPDIPILNTIGGAAEAISPQAAAAEPAQPHVQTWGGDVEAPNVQPFAAESTRQPEPEAGRPIMPSEQPSIRRERTVPAVARIGGIDWAGHALRGLPPERLRSLEQGFMEKMENVRAKDRALFPLGIEITPERVQEVRDLEAALIVYAQNLGIDISDRVFPEVSQDYIRFLKPEEFEMDQSWREEHFGIKDHGALTTDSGFVVVPEVPDKSGILGLTQHELGHRMGYSKNYLWCRAPGKVVSGPWYRGAGAGNTFSALDEGIAVMMAYDIQHSIWESHASLAPYAAAPSLNEQLRARTQDGGHIISKGTVLAAMTTTMAERASKITGEDAKRSLLRLHFSGDIEALHLLSSAFGNRAVTALAKLDQYAASGQDIIDFCESIGTKKSLRGRSV